MNCPTCGNETDQQQLGPDERDELGYRCAACGRLYSLSIADNGSAEIQTELNELKAPADALSLEERRLLDHVAETQARLDEATRSRNQAKGRPG